MARVYFKKEDKCNYTEHFASNIVFSVFSAIKNHINKSECVGTTKK